MISWLRTHTMPLLVGVALLALPMLYIVNVGISVRPLNPLDHAIENGLTYALLVVFSYVNYTRFIPRWYLPKHYTRYGLVVATCIFFVTMIPHRIEQWTFLQPPKEPTVMGWVRQLLWEENLFPDRRQQPPGPRFRPGDRPPPPDGRRPDRMGPPRQPPGTAPGRFPQTPLPAKLALISLLCIISTLASVSVQINGQLKRVETEKLQAELRQLKAQINPHFLFNTLNSIYALALRKDDRTAETIVKLSEFMRYMIRDAHNITVPLLTETNYITNYIDLQRARLRDSVTIEYTLTGAVTNQEIAPLLLFTFIENAFKYGVNPDDTSLIVITLSVERNQLRLHVFNRKVRTSHAVTSDGVGLVNANERLRLLYPDHQLLIDDVPTHYTVDLTLTLA